MTPQGRPILRTMSAAWLYRCVIVCVFCVLFTKSAAAITVTDEARLRAAVIVGIMRFTRWSEGHVNLGGDNVNVCLVGHPISGSGLLPISGLQNVAGRQLRVERRTSFSVEDCHVIVIGDRLSNRRFGALMDHADFHSLLSVCDGCRREVSEEAIIALTLREQKVHFSVNLAKAKRIGVLLDAQLLELAEEVRK